MFLLIVHKKETAVKAVSYFIWIYSLFNYSAIDAPLKSTVPRTERSHPTTFGLASIVSE